MSALAGVGVAVTRPGDGPGRLGELLALAGATVIHWPCIRFEEPMDDAPIRRAVKRRESYDWLVLTSPRAARAWLALLERTRGTGQRIPERESGPRTAVVGPATARVLREAGRRVDRVADVRSATGLVAAFRAEGDAAGARVLCPCSDMASDELAEGLRELGARVDRVVAYRTVASPPDAVEVARAATAGTVRVVTFTSPSTVEGFFAALDAAAAAWLTGRLAAAAIGSTTRDALAAAGWAAETAPEPSLEGLVEAAARAAARPSRVSP